MNRKQGRKRLKAVLIVLGSIPLIFFSLFPIFWCITTSLKGSLELRAIPPNFLFKPTLENWDTIINDWNAMSFLKSSLIVGIGTILLTVPAGTLGAYALSRFNFKGRRMIALDILTVRMIPPIVTAIPIFVLARKIGVFDTYGLLILLNTTFNLPWTIWIMKGFLEDIPVAIEEAGLVDGCSRLQVFAKIVLPLAIPGLAVCTILCFIFSWNEFLFANIMVSGSRRPLSVLVGMSMKQRAILWGPATATATFAVTPIIALSIAVRKFIVRGLTFGAVKG